MPRPKLYELKLCESPVLDGGRNYERFSFDWFLDVDVDIEGGGRGRKNDEDPDEGDPNSPSKITLLPGDVLYIPELATGAGEFETVRFIGYKTTDRSDDENHEKILLPLLKASVEIPEFPPEILGLFPSNDLLKDTYERIFDTVLSLTVGGPDTLKDIMGGSDTELDEYWSNPSISRPTKKRAEEKPRQWIIPLKSCQIVSIM